MNASSSRESERAQESTSDGGGKTLFDKPKFTVSSWSRLKDPRIVRVSRAFGGKDRHSKVCTVRGLKDRRVRLSVPTAIQLYDLQDRLGLNQPSKVVDWLLDVAKDEIDELPPLKIPFGTFGNDVPTIENSGSLNWEDFWNPNRHKDVLRETSGIRGDQEEGNDHDHHHGTAFAQPSTFFAKNNHSSPPIPCLLNPNGSFFKWDPSNLSLSQFGSHESSMTPSHPQQAAVHDFNAAALASMPPPATQLFSYPQTQSYFQTSSSSSRSRNPLMSSSSDFTLPPLFTLNQGMRPFHLSMNPKFFSSQLDHHGNDEPDKGN